MVETLCMKGLILTHLGRRDEGLELVKQGVRLDLTSHICWHVFGLIQKGQKNYEEALKSYTQALRFDKVRRTSSTACIYACLQGRAPPRRTSGGISQAAIRDGLSCTTSLSSRTNLHRRLRLGRSDRRRQQILPLYPTEVSHILCDPRVSTCNFTRASARDANAHSIVFHPAGSVLVTEAASPAFLGYRFRPSDRSTDTPMYAL